ncbi:MAG: SHOCT domain-containing protein, partial [Actinomycetes bacterium]
MPGLVRGVARTAVVAGTATAVSNRVSRRQANRWAEQAPPPQQGY